VRFGTLGLPLIEPLRVLSTAGVGIDSETGGKKPIGAVNFKSGGLGNMTFDTNKGGDLGLETLTGLDICEEVDGCMLIMWRTWQPD
jgi:hypothetical protein